MRKAAGSVVERGDIIAAMERWSMEFIEQPNAIVGDLPVRPFAKDKSASDSLLGSRYYEHFTPAMLRAVGMPRETSSEEDGRGGC